MNIAFITTQTDTGSTVVGRILPLAQELAKRHEVSVLVHGRPTSNHLPVSLVGFGVDPFIRTTAGKKRASGFALIWRMKMNALAAAMRLRKLKPDVVIISKSLPESVFAAWLYSWIASPKFILDVDDFELEANTLSSMIQRAAVHVAERMGTRLAHAIAVASPFLHDRFSGLAPHKKVVTIPTGTIAETYPLHTSHTKTIGYIGSLTASTGQRVDMLPAILEEVRKKVSGAKLLLAGGGDDMNSLLTEFKNRGLESAVDVTGPFTSADIPGILAKCDVLIDPVDASVVNRAKSSSRVLLAGRAGLLVVTSNVGIRPEFIPHSLWSACFANPGDSNSYAEKISEAFTSPLSEKQAKEFQEHIHLFFWNKLAVSYESLWK